MIFPPVFTGTRLPLGSNSTRLNSGCFLAAALHSTVSLPPTTTVWFFIPWIIGAERVVSIEERKINLVSILKSVGLCELYSVEMNNIPRIFKVLNTVVAPEGRFSSKTARCLYTVRRNIIKYVVTCNFYDKVIT